MANPPGSETFVHLLRDRAQARGDQRVFTFLRDGEHVEGTTTYGELDLRARAVAARLQDAGVARGARAVLVYPSGLEYVAVFFGCLYAGVVAVPTYPPRPKRDGRRFESLIADAGATVVLTTRAVGTQTLALLDECVTRACVRRVLTNDISSGDGALYRESTLSAPELAFLQYTSGSTSAPRGVRVSHANLLHNQSMLRAAFGTSQTMRVVSWLPLYHDMGLIGAVLHPVYVGGSCVLMSPAAFLQQPARWLRAIAGHGATISGAPDFAYDICVRQIGEEAKTGLDLSCWEVAFNGAEPVRAETLMRFAHAFERWGFNRDAFYPCYGLAEATLFVTGGAARGAQVRAFDADALERHRVTRALDSEGRGRRRRTLVSCGREWDTQRLLIVNPETSRPVGPDDVGEVWVRGPSVAGGYWNRPEDTTAVFGGCLAGTTDGPFLRTGDLGFLHDGQLFLTGRLKDLVIVRGRNHAPQDLEHTVARSHTALHPDGGAVFSAEVDGLERLVVVHEVVRSASPTASIFESVCEALAGEHEVRPDVIVLIRKGTLPRTSSGKVRRAQCREAFVAGHVHVVARWKSRVLPSPADTIETPPAESESSLSAQVAAHLGVTPRALDPEQPLVRVGLDSLAAVELAHALTVTRGTTVSPAWLLDGASLRDIEHRVGPEQDAKSDAVRPAPATTAGTDDTGLVSHGERALYFLHEIAPTQSTNHIAHAASVTSALRVDVLRDALAKLADRHPALRSRYTAPHGRPRRHVADPGAATPDFAEIDLGPCDEAALRARLGVEARAPFDLNRGPLWRLRLLDRRGAPPVLLLVLHHIVADLWSLAVLVEELGELYVAALEGRDSRLPDMGTTPWDYAAQERQRLAGDDGRRLAAYWETRWRSPVAALDLPTDRPRLPERAGRGAVARLVLDTERAQALRRLGSDHATTLQAVLLVAFQTLLARYARQSEVVVGIPAMCRRADDAHLVGYCVNTLPLRADLSEDPPVATLLARTRRALVGALAHQEYPFEHIVEQLRPARDPARHPLFQALCVLQQSPRRPELATFALGEPGLSMTMGPLTLESIETPLPDTPFDITLRAAQWDGELRLALEYDANLFAEDTGARLLESLDCLLRDIVLRPECRISELALVPPARRRQIVGEWNNTRRAIDVDRPLIAPILGRARARPEPDATALVFEGERRSYGDLERRINRLTHGLRRVGVRPEVRVGVLMERSFELVEAIVAILNAGGAYVPLDPAYPQERLAFIADDAQLRVLLTQRALQERARPLCPTILVCDDGSNSPYDDTDGDPRVKVFGDTLAYIIYTSGSTGRPKGAMNTHAALRNRIEWMQDACRLGPDDRVLQKTPIGFDVSVWEFFLPLLAGASMVLARPGEHQDTRYLADVITRERVTTLHFVPSLLDAFLSDVERGACPSLRRVICSGEALPVDLQARFFARFDCELHNLYGPTEAAVDVTVWRCLRDDTRRSVPIGRPIDNIQIHIVDRHSRPVPVGVPGELLIGGIGLARGYVGRADLTAERFVPNPLGEPGSRLYRTGDLARYLANGEIEFLGRLDQQVKIRGVRIELAEIEAALRRHSAVRDAVVITRRAAADAIARSNYRVADRPQGGLRSHRFFLKGARTADHPVAEPSRADRLIAYVVYEPGPSPAAGEWRRFLCEWLPETMVPHAFVAIPALPLLTNGKLDRRALPPPPRERLQASAAYEPPRNALEDAFVSIWMQVLGLDSVSIHDDFFELGGDSLRSLQVRASAEARGVEIALTEIFAHRTPAALAEVARVSQSPGEERSIAPFALVRDEDRRRLPEDVEDAYPLSRIQAGIIYHVQLQPDSPVYHDVFVYRVRAAFDETAFRTAVQEVVDRHPILRTSFDLARSDEPLQLVRHHVAAAIDVIDWRGLAPDAAATAEREFVERERWGRVDLAAPSQIRFFAQRFDDDVFQLVLSFHDVVLDGWSTAQLMTELVARYVAHRRGIPMVEPPLRVHYRDFVAAERDAIASADLQRTWERKLAGIEPTRLPHLRPRAATERNTLYEVPIDDGLSDGLKRAAQAAGIPLKHLLLAAHLRVLSLLSGRRRVLTGVETHGRLERLGAERCLGPHINTLPVHVEIGEQTWVDLARELFDLERELLPSRRYPYFELQKRFGKEPLLDTAFNFTHFHVFERLDGIPEVDLLGAWGFEETNFALRAEFNCNPFTGLVQLDLMAHLGELLPEQVEAIGGYYARALRAIADDPSARVTSARLLGNDEERRLLVDCNSAPPVSAPAATLHAWVEHQAARMPEAIAVESNEGTLSYAELVRRAGRLARRLRASGVGVDEAVGLCAERSFEMVVAVLGIQMAGAACLPLDPAYPPERLAYMVHDAGARYALAHAHLQELTHEWPSRVLDLGLFAGDGAVDEARAPQPVTADNVAYVIYTSGSTGTPRGVAMPHRPLVNLVAWQLAHSTGAASSRTLQFSPLSFDASFQEIFSTWASAGTLVLIDETTRRDPRALLRHLQKHRVQQLFCPFVALRQLAESAERHGLVLDELRHVLASGETLEVTPPLRAFFERHPEARLHNYWGPTETHVATGLTITGRAPTWSTLPPIGAAISGVRVYVLDADLAPVPFGVVGELYVGGDAVSRGYVRKPDTTAERFVPDPFSVEPGARLYRTGDLGRRGADGAIAFVGRRDRQVKIRGFRIEPGEIESVLQEHRGIAHAAVVPRRSELGHPRLVAYLQAADATAPPDVSDVRRCLRDRLPEYMVPTLFVYIDQMPLTPSGKIDRRTLPIQAPEHHVGRRPCTPPRTLLEEVVAGLFTDVLGAGRVGRDEDFFELGGDSLLATQLVSRMSAALGQEVPLRTLFEASTVAAFASRLDASTLPASAPLHVRRPRPHPLPLSFAQQRLFVAAQNEAQSRAYSNPVVIDVRGPLDVTRLKDVFREVVRRHEALRTVFRFDRGEPAQVVLETPHFEFTTVEMTQSDDPEGAALAVARRQAQRPVDLTRGPMLRVFVLRFSEQRHAVAAVLHHVASDGWSIGVLLREITTLYRGGANGASDLPELAVQYADFALWQRELLRDERLERLVSYWQGALHRLPELDLRTDRPRPATPTFQGARVRLQIPPESTAALVRLSRREGCTLFMTLLGAFNVLLCHASGARDFAVGTDVAQRGRPELEPLIGFFVNQLVLRAHLSGDPSFRTILARVRRAALDAYAHQDMPFDRLVAIVGSARSSDRSPLFNVKFVLQNAPGPTTDIDDLEIRFLDVDPGTAKFDLLVNVWEQGRELVGYFEYATDLFDGQTVERLNRLYASVLVDVAQDVDRRLSTMLRSLGRRERDLRERARVKRGQRQHGRLRELDTAHRDERRSTVPTDRTEGA